MAATALFIEDDDERKKLDELAEWVDGHIAMYPLLRRHIRRSRGLQQRIMRLPPHDGLAASIRGLQICAERGDEGLPAAQEWFQLGAESGIRWAGRRLGSISWRNGLQGESDYWLDWAIARGSAMAADFRAYTLEERGQKDDALQWKRLAADLGDPEDALYIGRIHEERGETDTALSYYRVSALHKYGQPKAARAIARLIYRTDKASSIEWSHRASKLAAEAEVRHEIAYNISPKIRGWAFLDDSAPGRFDDIRLDELASRHRPDGGAPACFSDAGCVAIVAGTVAATLLLKPFFESLAQKAGEDAYKLLRKFVARMLGKATPTPDDPESVTPDPASLGVKSAVLEDKESGTWVLVPLWLWDRMYDALTQINFEDDWCQGKVLYYSHGDTGGRGDGWAVYDYDVPIVDWLDVDDDDDFWEDDSGG